MLRDVFYYGAKPNIHPRERLAKDLEDARRQATTEHFWIVNEYCDYTNFDWDFDFDFLPDDQVWHEECNNVWPSVHQKDSGTWLCPKDETEHTVYRVDVEPLKRHIDMSNWVLLDKIDKTQFDFSWHPDPTDPPYIYKWGCAFYKAQVNHVLEYVTPGATQDKWMTFVVALEPDYDNLVEVQKVDRTKFDMSWRPDPLDPPYIYVWGNKYIDGTLKSTLEYHTPGATEKKYMQRLLPVLPEYDRWVEVVPVNKNKFDFTWRPDPREPPYIYVWGNKYYSGEYGATLEYHTPGATERKYMTNDVEILPVMNNYKVLHEVENFDFAWRPNPTEPPYIYVFGNQYYPAEIDPTVEYHVEGATERKYVSDIVAKLKPNRSKFKILHSIVESKFDFAWTPNPKDPPYIYVWGNQWNSAEKEHTVEYHVEGATEYKYLEQVAVIASNKSKFEILHPILEDKFDFSWRPDPYDDPFIYIFGNNLYPGEIMPTVRYVVPGATQEKFVDNTAKLAQCYTNWYEVLPVDKTKFDFSWVPNPKDPPYIYVFGNQYNSCEIEHTLEYRVPGATEYKYVYDKIAQVLPDKSKYKALIPIDESKFNFSWRPNPKDPPYIYVFGNQWNHATIEPTLEYHVEGATEYKYITDIVANTAADKTNFKILMPIVEEEFDFSWRPNPKDPAYIYVFGNQWYGAEKQHTVEYHVPGATEYKYVTDIIATLDQNYENWDIPETIDTETFDFSWVPNPGAPPYIYQFGTLADDNDGPRYITPDNNGEVVRLQRIERKNIDSNYRVNRYYIETTLEDLIEQHKNEIFWAMNKNINYDSFDFSWRPSIEQARYVHVFGSPESVLTQTYFVSAKMYQQGYKDFNFVQENITLDESYLASLFKPSDVFFVDRGNSESAARFEKLKEQFPNIIKTRYLNSWVDTINRCIKRSTTQVCWILNSDLDYTDFDFKYYPNPWQMNMVHVFGTQWSHWGTTFMVNKETFPEDTKYIKIIEHLGNLHFVKSKRAKATNNLYDVFLIDHGNSHTAKIKEQLESKLCGKQLTVVPYKSNYLTTFNDIIEKCATLKEHYIWITSSVCDYTNFDLSYICDPFAKENLHVFPSDGQKFGDTFLVDVNRMRDLLKDMTLLEDYNKINYNQHQRAQRLPAPVFISEQDSHHNVTDQNYDFPYAIFKTHDNSDLDVNYKTPISLWSDDTKNIEILSTGGSVIVVPNEVRNYVKEELYDYPYINRAERLVKSKPLDIVFLSNGEKCADENYEHLLRATKNFPNRVVRVDGVNGRAKGYHASAEASQTPWTFTVFAKLKVNNRFDWSWQPDRLQIPKHYIFNALNPVNNLVYGHQAMIAYNKKLVLNNTGRGLDFTLDDPHESIDLLSGVATFNTDPYSTWRTAFREVIKLKSDYKDISYERLQTWLTVAEGQYAQDCLQGAKDGVEYYNNVSGDTDKLKLSYEWDWLKDYYNRKYT